MPGNLSLHACHQPHDYAVGCYTRQKLTTSPASAPKETVAKHCLPGRLTSGGMSAQEHLPSVTPSRRSLVTECQQMATLHLLQPGAPFPSLIKQPQTDLKSGNAVPQMPLTQITNGCVALMLKPYAKLPAAPILSNKATWSHWTLGGETSSHQFFTCTERSSTYRSHTQMPPTNTAAKVGATRGGMRSAVAMSARPRPTSGCKMTQLFRQRCSACPPPRQPVPKRLANTFITEYSMQMLCLIIIPSHATAN